MDVVLLASDLMVVSRVQGAAAKTGISVHAVSSVAQAATLCRDKAADLLIVDLSTPSLDLEFVPRLKAETVCSTRIVAFGPHVHELRLAAVREAGCDLVMSRGQFFNEVDAILQRAAN